MARPVPDTRRRVLVVDDDEDSVESLAALVALMGHESVAARDGAEALKLAASFRPDTVLLDLGMPRMNGFEVCRAIREEPWGASMTIVAVTGWGQSEDRIRTSAAGFDDHFMKPLEPAALAEFLARPLPRAAVVEPDPAPAEAPAAPI
jgi:CheY-like chemotaxis protein